eukprot:CAMPEP_0174369424 /NCGR_PEP_ID=MMETSP0811_2-20130205/92432_1 /TAXON_ID=73025 ORGANISM="Eutreptiella gymnastica-like, Strain CCMP1594" /NCGR_SAMPLE_ID=MMETSP0811_2 /ASSEMBLY_ACC=CAM_ASM_000667 /LENGTH=61 /DNA_ID=CAMNT_0015513863 /DNA_START=108 /DNA_END=291 /DNA_ORIENTATION=+
MTTHSAALPTVAPDTNNSNLCDHVRTEHWAEHCQQEIGEYPQASAPGPLRADEGGGVILLL